MPPFLIALFKINLVLVLFVALYYAVLRRLTYYQLNRCVLLLGILFSCSYPLMDLSGFFDGAEMGAVPELSRQLRTMVTVEAIPAYVNYLYVLFFIGFAVILVRMVKQGIALYRIHRQSQAAYIDEQPVQLISEPVGAFSFCRKIYINPSLHQQQSLATIVAHERVHVRQWHSVDILLVEIGLLFYWFNPAAWLLRKAVKENLEFIADRAVLTSGTDRRSYQYSLLQVTNVHVGLAITNDFNLVDLKQRIRMMNRKRSPRFTLISYVVLLPLLVAGCLAFTVSVKESVQLLLQPKEAVVVEAIAQPGDQPINEASALHTRPLHTPAMRPATAAHDRVVADQAAAYTEEEEPARARLVAAQPLSAALQAPLYERPSTAGLQPGKTNTASTEKPQLQEVVVVGRPTRRPATTAGTVTAEQPQRVVGGQQVPGAEPKIRVGQPAGAVGGTAVVPNQRTQGVRLPANDTSGVRVVTGYRNPRQ